LICSRIGGIVFGIAIGSRIAVFTQGREFHIVDLDFGRIIVVLIFFIWVGALLVVSLVVVILFAFVMRVGTALLVLHVGATLIVIILLLVITIVVGVVIVVRSLSHFLVRILVHHHHVLHIILLLVLVGVLHGHHLLIISIIRVHVRTIDLVSRVRSRLHAIVKSFILLNSFRAGDVKGFRNKTDVQIRISLKRLFSKSLVEFGSTLLTIADNLNDGEPFVKVVVEDLVWLDKGLNVLVEVFLFFILETFDVESNLDMGLFGSDGFNDILFLVDNNVLGLSEGLMNQV